MKSGSIGGLLLDAGKISPADAERILRLQKEKGLRFGDAGKALGLLTEEDIQKTLAQQFSFPVVSEANNGLSPDLVAVYRPLSPQVETLRAVRSQLMLRWFADGHKTLAIVSAARNEGRSFLAANLAVVFSLLGEKTLLIDADLRQPRQREMFNFPEKLGLIDILAERVDFSVINKVDGFKGLSVLGAGTAAPNHSELISRRLGGCLDILASHYDVILLDTSSSAQGSDALVAAVKAQGALLVARQNHTRLADLERLKDSLDSFGVASVGNVISDF